PPPSPAREGGLTCLPSVGMDSGEYEEERHGSQFLQGAKEAPFSLYQSFANTTHPHASIRSYGHSSEVLHGSRFIIDC
ncbi:MAG: hypothetical protein OSA95_04515, partial [Opitutales bacterium]|nr:hypothetical protein [Opitutales bacterium]